MQFDRKPFPNKRLQINNFGSKWGLDPIKLLFDEGGEHASDLFVVGDLCDIFCVALRVQDARIWREAWVRRARSTMTYEADRKTTLQFSTAKTAKQAKWHIRRPQPKRGVKKRTLRRPLNKFVPSPEIAFLKRKIQYSRDALFGFIRKSALQTMYLNERMRHARCSLFKAS